MEKKDSKKKKIPVYQLVIDDNSEEMEGMTAISLVSAPAIEVGWVAMSKEPVKFEVQDQEKRVILGPVLVPGMEIYRKDFDGNPEAYVFFSADDVEKIVQKFFQQGNEKNVTLEHALSISGGFLYQAFLSDKEHGINPSQFADLPDKTFFAAYKITDDDLWQSIKDGIFTGFSLEGFFDSLLIKQSRELTDYERLKRLLALFEGEE